MHSDVPGLRGSGSVTNPARKIPAQVSFSRHAISLVRCSRDEGLASVSALVRVSGSLPMHASSESERADCSDWEWCSTTGARLPSGAGVGFGSGVGEIAGVAVLAAVGLSVGVDAGGSFGVALGSGAGVGVGVLAGVAVGAAVGCFV